MPVYSSEKFRRGAMIAYSGKAIMVKMKDPGIAIVSVSKWLAASYERTGQSVFGPNTDTVTISDLKLIHVDGHTLK